MTNILVLTFPEYQQPANRLAEELQCPSRLITIHHFPDQESLVKLPPTLPEHVVFCLSLDRPNAKLVELGLAAAAARENGACRLSLVAPYLCYMRQDKAFHPGEAVSQRVIGSWLSGWFDDVITVDAHLHRTHDLREVFPGIRAVNLSASPLMAKFLLRRNDCPVLLGPDIESRQWVATIAEEAGLDYGIATKRRLNDTHVTIELPDISFRDRTVVLIDDMVTSGHTLSIAAQLLAEQGVAGIECLVTHALLADDAEELLARSAIQHFYSTDSIPHHSNVIYLAQLLANSLR